jgi:hypothetical protein
MPIRDSTGGNETGALHIIVGLPLVAGLSSRQLAAAIVGELVLFQNTPPARSARQLRRVIGWLAGIVAYRDSVDESIDDTCENGSGLSRPFAYFTRWLVRMIRGLLGVLLFLGVLLARRLADRQQFAADALAARIAGPPEFRAMVKSILMLEGSVFLATRNLRKYQTDKMPEDFPGFVAVTEKRLPSTLRHAFQFKAEHEQAKLTPLQTATSERIQKSMELGRGAQLELDRPAMDLLPDSLLLFKEATLHYYQKQYHEDIAHKAWLVPNEEFLRQEEERAFGTTLVDEMIDPHEGDKWHKWRQYLSTTGSILLTIGILSHAATNLAKINEPVEAKYRRHVGNWIIVPDSGTRRILDVKYFKEGDTAGYRKKDTSLAHAFIKNDEKVAIEAPSTGWFYDTGNGYVVRCDAQEKRAFLYEEPTGGEDEVEKFRREVGGDTD